MPKVLIVAEGDLSPLLGASMLWSRAVERFLTPSAEAALEVGPSLVPSLVVVEAVPGRSAATLVRRLRAHAGLHALRPRVLLPQPGRPRFLQCFR